MVRWWLSAAAIVATGSAGALAWLASGEVIPSAARDRLVDFVQPGVTVWWFVLAGPFRTAPSSPAGIAFAAAANTACWLLVLWCAVAGVRAVRRRLAAPVIELSPGRTVQIL